MLLEIGYLKDIWKKISVNFCQKWLYLHASFSPNMQSGFKRQIFPKSVVNIKIRFFGTARWRKLSIEMHFQKFPLSNAENNFTKPKEIMQIGFYVRFKFSLCCYCSLGSLVNDCYFHSDGHAMAYSHIFSSFGDLVVCWVDYISKEA